jgi:glycogen debranching enzyme
MDDVELRARALAVLTENHRDGYTVPAQGLYPYQWCWDSGPIALGWAAAGRWDNAWAELTRLLSAQWETGMVPHIVFWQEDDTYFPGPSVWGTGRTPATTGITQPALPISAAAQLFSDDPDRARAQRALGALWPNLCRWLDWISSCRKGPHGAGVVVHPWETGMDNSPSWDAPLAQVPEADEQVIERRDVATVAASQRPSQSEYRRYIRIVEDLRAAGWRTERQAEDSPFVVEDPAFTAIALRAAEDLVAVADRAGLDASGLADVRSQLRAGLDALWDEDLGWYRPFDVRAGAFVGPATSTGLTALWAGVPSDRFDTMLERIDVWTAQLRCGLPTSQPDDPAFDPVRYWRGPVWVLVNYLVAVGLARAGHGERAEGIRQMTRDLVTGGFTEYYDPRNADGIGGQNFSWSAALTLAWLTRPGP